MVLLCWPEVCQDLHFQCILMTQMFLYLVLSVFSKTGAKNAKHGWVSSVSTVMSVSNLIVQTFQHHFSQCRFRSHHSTPQSDLVISRFALLPAIAYLCSLGQLPRANETWRFVEISEHDRLLFKEIILVTQNIAQALKTFKGRKKVTDNDQEDEEED